MGRCATCRKIIFGGLKQGDLRFCSEPCLQQGFLIPLAERAAPDLVAAQVRALHQGTCPVCGGDGPIDIHTSHTAWSAIVLTSWKSKPQLSCGRCGTTAICKGLAITAIFGWWGFPWGIVVTPWQLLNGAKALVNRPHPDEPSDELNRLVRIQIAKSMVQQNVT